IIRIYTERGDLIKTIVHDDGSGDEAWESVTSSRQLVVSGVYIAHFEVTRDYYDPETGELLYKKGDQAIRKFIIIR
ncbi:fibronectin, partial [candidate division WOR-3 bacterium]|nr:fibronectin [candidate division WOR-3 bacterium]